MPPSAGPTMVAVCQAEEFQATAFGKCSAGTRLGISAWPAGIGEGAGGAEQDQQRVDRPHGGAADPGCAAQQTRRRHRS